MDIEALADLLHETSEHHGNFEAVAPPHNWWDWYAAYMHAREAGSSSDEAVTAAAATWRRSGTSSCRPPESGTDLSAVARASRNACLGMVRIAAYRH